MSSRRQPRITNIWSKVIESDGGNLCSKVVIESTEAFEYKTGRRGNDIVLEAPGAVANMPEGSIEVNDGMVGEITLTQAGSDTSVVTISPDHPTGYKVEVFGGIPVRTAVILDRSFLYDLFKDKRIVLDPGHGGEDWGGKGPVSLIEKNVVVIIARNLKKLFEQKGARAIVTRDGDDNISLEDRFNKATAEKADLFISIHTYANKDSKVGGTAVRYGPSSPESADLAALIKEGLLKKLKLPDRGVAECGEYTSLGNIPAVKVEVVTITNWMEEGLLRSPTFHKKAAEGIFNGVKNYYAINTGDKKV